MRKYRFYTWTQDQQHRIYVERIESEGSPKATTSLGYIDVLRDIRDIKLVEMVEGSRQEMLSVIGEALTDSESTSVHYVPEKSRSKAGEEKSDNTSDHKAGGETVTEKPRPVPQIEARPKPQAPVVAIRPHSYVDLALNEPGQSIKHLIDQKTYRQGFVGEQRTAGALSPLLNLGWKLIHSVKTSEAKDIDHLLIGPIGVLAINTKTSDYPIVMKNGKVTSGSHDQQVWLDSVDRDALIASDMLSYACGEEVKVRGVVLGWSSVGVTTDSLRVLDGMNVIPSLKTMPRILDQTWIDSIFDQARRDKTWKVVLD